MNYKVDSKGQIFTEIGNIAIPAKFINGKIIPLDEYSPFVKQLQQDYSLARDPIIIPIEEPEIPLTKDLLQLTVELVLKLAPDSKEKKAVQDQLDIIAATAVSVANIEEIKK